MDTDRNWDWPTPFAAAPVPSSTPKPYRAKKKAKDAGTFKSSETAEAGLPARGAEAKDEAPTLPTAEPEERLDATAVEDAADEAPESIIEGKSDDAAWNLLAEIVGIMANKRGGGTP